ncbi:MAG: GFA family protein [Gammaproteobacteria bacterium]|nr:GFA family protein [Gammaproteobacteria bacterium]
MAINLRDVDGITVLAIHKASCHCGSVEIELDLPDGLINVRRCDCSMCRRRGAVAASVPLSGIHILKGRDVLKLYQFNTKTAKHYFCGNCGIYTHHQRRSNPEQYGFNVACLEGINPLTIEDIPTYDGVNHPADRNTGP